MYTSQLAPLYPGGHTQVKLLAEWATHVPVAQGLLEQGLTGVSQCLPINKNVSQVAECATSRPVSS